MFVTFNQPPKGKQPTTTIIEFLLQAFRSTKKKSVVWGAMFRWTDEEFTTDLNVVCAERSLRLRIVAGDEFPPVLPLVVKAFFAARVEEGGIWQLRPMKRRNHNKWFLFDELDFDWLKKNLPAGAFCVGSVPSKGLALFVSSGNLTPEDRTKHNAAVLLPVDRDIATALIARFKTLKNCYLLSPFGRAAAAVIGVGYREAEDARFKVHQFPRRWGDTIVEALANVDPAISPAAVFISNNRWSRVGVANTLKALYATKNASIDIVARSPSDSSDQDHDGDEEPEMTQPVAEILKECSTRYWQNSEAKFIIHSKYMLMDGPYKQPDGSYARRQLVWIGTPTMTDTALKKSFETLVLLKNEPGAYQAFLGDFTTYLKQTATAKPPHTPGNP